MRAVYIPREDWDSLYLHQATQSGHGIPGFEGVAFQRGGGLGNILGRLFRFVLPVAKKAAKAVGKQALTSGADILSDVVKGRNLKESAEEHGRAALENLAGKAVTKMRGGGNVGKRPKSIKGGQTVKRKQPAKKGPGGKRQQYLKNVKVTG
jgi:hypothetical protein